MIRNFEKYTHEITLVEKEIVLPWLILRLILCIGKDKAITNKKLVDTFNISFFKNPLKPDKYVRTEAARIRKLIHIIRVNDVIPFLLAGTKGYYIADDKTEIETYLGSVEDRLRAIHKIRSALKRQLAKDREAQDGIQTKLIIE